MWTQSPLPHDPAPKLTSLFVGTVASLIGVAGAGFRLSLLLNAVSCEVASANAGFEVHGISKSVTLFSMMLKQTGHVLRGADSVHSREAVETAKSIAEEGTRVFEEIQDMLDRVSTKNSSGTVSPSIQQRFRWCFKKHRVTYLLAQLESLKLSLSVMLQVIQLGKLMASASRRYELTVSRCIWVNATDASSTVILLMRWPEKPKQ